MKKACNCLLLALLIQVVASCGNLNLAEPSKDYDSSIKTLTITTGEQSVAGSILPSRLDYSALTYYFVLDNLITTEKTLQVFASTGSGVFLNFPIELETGYYRIGVYALDTATAASYSKEKFGKSAGAGGFNDGELKDGCLSAGSATVDLRQDEIISVTLSTSGLNNAGEVNFNFYTNGWTLDRTKYTASCCIKNKAGTMVGHVAPVSLDAVSNVEPAPGTSPTYSATLTAGAYVLCVTYTNIADPLASYTWTEPVLVLSNQIINKNIALVDVIEYAPDAPSDFKASYLDFDPSSVWCYVNFAWTDNSVNEKEFQIDLKAVQASASDALFENDMADSWSIVPEDRSGASVTGSYTVSNFDNDGAGGEGIRKDGSLNKNNTSATFKLSRGVRYLARIRSLGYDRAGNSDYCYLSFTAGTGKTGYSDFATDARYIRVGN